MRWFIIHGAMFASMIVASIGLMGVMNPDAMQSLLLQVVPERMGYLFLVMGGVGWVDYITRIETK